MTETSTLFRRYVGINYSGAETPGSTLKNLRVYSAEPDSLPVEVSQPSPRKWWTRRSLAAWLVETLGSGPPTLLGINHGFSFPIRYFEKHGLEPDWGAFLDDFQKHWPTDEEHTYVCFVSDGLSGDCAARSGDRRWKRLTEVRARAGSVFRFQGFGAAGPATHAGLPWLRFLRQRVGDRVHFWPFDGWEIPAGRSVVAEVHPPLWKKAFPPVGRTPDQHKAWSTAEWMRLADLDGRLAEMFRPGLLSQERAIADIEGWILGADGGREAELVPFPTARRLYLAKRDEAEDGRGEAEDGRGGTAVFSGTIAWDPDSGETAGLPMLVIDNREVRWEDFGRKLMVWEGWGFRLEIIDPSGADNRA